MSDTDRWPAWRPISTAPRDGRFLTWRPSYKTLAVVRRFDDAGDEVVDPISGKIWRANSPATTRATVSRAEALPPPRTSRKPNLAHQV